MIDSVISMAWRNLRRNSRRSAIAFTMIGFGVAALIVAGGFVDSLLVKLREDTIHSRLGHIQVQRAEYAEHALSEPYAHLLPARSGLEHRIEALSGVRMIAPRLAVSGLVSAGETTLSFTAQAVDPVREAALARGLAVVSGAPLAPGDESAVLLGEGLASNLGVKPGDKVALLVTDSKGGINGMDMVVRGTFGTVSKTLDNVSARIPIKTAERLLRVDAPQRWVILLNDTNATATVADDIARLLPSRDFSITRWDQDAAFYHKTAALFARQFGFVRVVVVAIIVLGILNTMTMNVIERTWEIGVMLALGDSPRHILALFGCEGALLGVVGSAVGVAVGLAAGIAANVVGIPMPAPPGMSRGFDAGISLSVPLFLAASALGVAAAFVASLVPAMRASRLPIVDALRARH
jgi:putative ABC transport system permease protein